MFSSLKCFYCRNEIFTIKKIVKKINLIKKINLLTSIYSVSDSTHDYILFRLYGIPMKISSHFRTML